MQEKYAMMAQAEEGEACAQWAAPQRRDEAFGRAKKGIFLVFIFYLSFFCRICLVIKNYYLILP